MFRPITLQALRLAGWSRFWARAFRGNASGHKASWFSPSSRSRSVPACCSTRYSTISARNQAPAYRVGAL